MKKILFIPLIFFFQLPILNRASAQRFPVVLTQQLYQPPQRIVVDHRHDVTVVLDTANFVDVRTTGNIDELDSLRFPDGQLHLSADGLTLSVDSTFPYRSDIRIHTAASKVELEACHFSRLTVSSHDGHPVRLASFEANAYSGSLIFVDIPVVCSEHAVLGAHKEGAVVYYDSVNAPKHDWNLNDGGQVVHRMSDGGSETRRMVQFLPFGLLDLFSAKSDGHRQYPLFLSYAIGLGGASQHPFGGLTGWMGDYNLSTGTLFNTSVHYAFVLSSHWSLGVGIGFTALVFRAENCLLGITPGATEGQPSHLGPVAEPSALGPGQRTWRSKTGAAGAYLPLRFEWRQRDDWRGLRLAAELQPGINFGSPLIYRNGIYTDGSRTDMLVEQISNDFISPLRCDVRLEAAWNHIGVFLQASLLPFFRTSGENAFDVKYYPMSIGLSFTI